MAGMLNTHFLISFFLFYLFFFYYKTRLYFYDHPLYVGEIQAHVNKFW